MFGFCIEILSQIFSYLQQSSLINVVRVSKHWNSIATPILWQKPRFKGGILLTYADLFETYGHYINDVQFGVHYHNTGHDVQLVADFCSNITSVKVCSSVITTGEFAVLCERLSDRLEYLSFESCIWWREMILLFASSIAKLGKLKRLEIIFTNFDDEACEKLVTGCLSPQVIYLEHSNVGDNGIDHIVRYIPHIRSLSIVNCELITDKSIISIAESCSMLATLCLDCTDVTDVALSALSFARCRETITILSFDGCEFITDNGVRQIVTRFTNLLRLNIGCCSKITDDLFNEPSWECTKLVELNVGGLDIGSLALSFISNLTSLVSLNVLGIKGDVSKRELLSIAKLPNLQTVRLSCNDSMNCNLVKEISIEVPSVYIYMDMEYPNMYLKSGILVKQENGGIDYSR
jgi:F-box-like